MNFVPHKIYTFKNRGIHYSNIHYKNRGKLWLKKDIFVPFLLSYCINKLHKKLLYDIDINSCFAVNIWKKNLTSKSFYTLWLCDGKSFFILFLYHTFGSK